jgi:hypothetical protein
MLPPNDPRIKELIRRLQQVERMQERLSNMTLALIDEFKRLIEGGAFDEHFSGRSEKEKELGKVARSLYIEDSVEGDFQFTFDGLRDKTFALPPQLSNLLAFLSAARPCKDGSADPSVGWRTREETLAYLQALSKREVLTPGSLNSAVDRLKKAVSKHDGRSLVVTHPVNGLRLLVRAAGVRGLEKTPARDWM